MSEKVLLIDDEQDFLEVMAERMQNRDIDVTTATSAKNGLDLALQENFDAIILDLQMPEMDGMEALKKLKSIDPDLQIILLTGHGTVEKGVQAMKLGAADFLEKPADMQELTEKIKKAHARKVMLVEKETEAKIRSILGSKGW
ncbi:MAG: response regulator [Desulfobulbus sp.]|nr:response regulator [Desulfobulbus sp.]